MSPITVLTFRLLLLRAGNDRGDLVDILPHLFLPRRHPDSRCPSESPADSSRCSSNRSSASLPTRRRARQSAAPARSAACVRCSSTSARTRRSSCASAAAAAASRAISAAGAPPSRRGIPCEAGVRAPSGRRATAPRRSSAAAAAGSGAGRSDTGRTGRPRPSGADAEAALVVVHVEIGDPGRDAEDQQRRRGLRPHRQVAHPGPRSRHVAPVGRRDRGKVGVNRRARRDAHEWTRQLGRRPLLQPQTHTLQIGQLVPAALAGGDVPFERRRAVPARSRRTGTRSTFRRDRRCSRKECQPWCVINAPPPTRPRAPARVAIPSTPDTVAF